MSSASVSSGKLAYWELDAKRGGLILNDPPGAAVWGMLDEVERTPPVRRPARSEARGLAVVMAAWEGRER